MAYLFSFSLEKFGREVFSVSSEDLKTFTIKQKGEADEAVTKDDLQNGFEFFMKESGRQCTVFLKKKNVTAECDGRELFYSKIMLDRLKKNGAAILGIIGVLSLAMLLLLSVEMMPLTVGPPVFFIIAAAVVYASANKWVMLAATVIYTLDAIVFIVKTDGFNIFTIGIKLFFIVLLTQVTSGLFYLYKHN